MTEKGGAGGREVETVATEVRAGTEEATAQRAEEKTAESEEKAREATDERGGETVEDTHGNRTPDRKHKRARDRKDERNQQGILRRNESSREEEKREEEERREQVQPGLPNTRDKQEDDPRKPPVGRSREKEEVRRGGETGRERGPKP